MKKLNLIALLMALTLVGCSNPGQGGNTNPNPNPDISLPDGGDTGNSEGENSNPPAPVIETKTIAEVRKLAEGFDTKVNEAGVYESDIEVKLDNLELGFILDSGTTKQLYGPKNYKYFFFDGENYIYAKAPGEYYTENVKKYKGQKGHFDIQGKIAYYNGEVELSLTDKPVFTGIADIGAYNDDYINHAEEMTLQQYYEFVKTIPLNIKGNGFSKLVKMDVKCLARDINNTNMYFGQDNLIIKTHGHDKITNGVARGSNYTVIGAINIFGFLPEIEIIDIKPCTKEVNYTVGNNTMTCDELYTYSFKRDEAYHPTNERYSQLYKSAYTVEGYLSFYLKDGKAYFVIDDVFHVDEYATQEAAFKDKAIVLCNERYAGVDKYFENAKTDPVLKYAFEETKIKATVFPYEYNKTGPHFKAYLYELSIA